jgi:ZIP family zinc transporter
MSALQGVLGYLLLPVVATLIGGTIATWRTPGPRLQSAIQHFAAGVVFAAVAGEILPEIRHQRAPIPVIIGFSLGVIAMLGMRYLTERLGAEGEESVDASNSVTSLLIAVGVDLLLDGLLVGIGFAAGAQNGILLSIALTLEVLFLGLATATALLKSGAGRRRVIGTMAGLAGVVALGAIVGVTLLARLSGAALEIALSFGAAALLYLVTEELLTEAHEVPETPLITAMFFLGFLALFLIELLT